MRHFTSESLEFFRGLARHNAKPWFEAHREDYERSVKQPMAGLVEEMDLRLAAFAPEIVGDPKRSVFRIYRDIRFSKDKSPYKTNAGCWFFHGLGSSKVGREAHGGGAGFYFHLQPGASFAAGGCWMPPRPALLRIRAAIDRDPRGFQRMATAPALKKLGGLSEEEALQRVPHGYDADHPAGQWLKLTSFTVDRPLSDAQVTGPRLTAILEREFKAITPLVRWLNEAIGLKSRQRR